MTARTATQAGLDLQTRLRNRPDFGSTMVLTPQSRFLDLVEVWLTDLGLQRLAEGTKQHCRDQLRLHVVPALKHYTLGEVTTGLRKGS